METFVAELIQESDGSWSAIVDNGQHLVSGQGDTKEAAVEDLKIGLSEWIQVMKEEGIPIPSHTKEYVKVEVAA